MTNWRIYYNENYSSCIFNMNHNDNIILYFNFLILFSLIKLLNVYFKEQLWQHLVLLYFHRLLQLLQLKAQQLQVKTNWPIYKFYASQIHKKCLEIRWHHWWLSIINGKIHTIVYDKWDEFSFPIVNFPFLEGDIPLSPSYGVYISQLVS